VAGGREPPSWEAYPEHQFLHTIGMLPCCAKGGCWRSRSVPLGDGDDKDDPKHLCVDVIDNLPHCMELITPGTVIEAIERSFEDRQLNYLPPEQAEATARFLRREARQVFADQVRNRLSALDQEGLAIPAKRISHTTTAKQKQLTGVKLCH